MTTEQNQSDADLARQPAAYWTGVAYEALITFTRTCQAEFGFTQPQYWLLRNLSKNDISPDGHAMSVSELREAMTSYLRPEDDLEAEADVLVERGWLDRDSVGLLSISQSGEEARLDLKSHAPEIRERIHAGISDADYVTALKVLQQMISNTQQQAR